MHRGSALASDYGFDTNGNRTAHRIGPASPLRGQSWPCLGALPAGGDSTVSGSYDAQDRMTAYGSCSYEYTRNGELTRRVDSATSSTTEYDYDEFGNLRRVVLPDNRVITYHIDGLNRRVGKSIDGVRQWGLLYANQLEPVAELDADGNVVSSFIYADRPHVPSLMLKGGQTYRLISDHLGSVRLVVNLATGAIAQRMSYDEYGNVVEDTNPGFQPFGYAGGLYDRDTGLVRFGARDYDALTGRWTAKDPIGFRGGSLNLYAYVSSNPIIYVDITGRAREKIDGHVITVHKSDVDPWPSQPHGHIYDKNLVVDTDGGIYNAANRDNVDQLSKKGKVKWKQFLKRGGFLGVCLSVADLMTGEVEADEMFADFLMIGPAGPEGTYWPEDDFGFGASPLDCGEHCPY